MHLRRFWFHTIYYYLCAMRKKKRTPWGKAVVLLPLVMLLAVGCASTRNAKGSGGRIYRAPKCPCALEPAPSHEAERTYWI